MIVKHNHFKRSEPVVRRDSQAKGAMPLFVALCCTAALLVVVFNSQRVNATEKNKNATADRLGNKRSANWDLLFFAIPERHITCVRIVLLEGSKVPDKESIPLQRFGLKNYRKKRFDITTKDKKVLITLGTYLNFPIRRSAPSDPSSGAHLGSNILLGYMDIRTKKNRFKIGISTNGFVLGSSNSTIHNTFYSWGAAMQIQELLFEHHHPSLSLVQFRTLSGEGTIEGDKRWWCIHRQTVVGPTKSDNKAGDIKKKRQARRK